MLTDSERAELVHEVNKIISDNDYHIQKMDTEKASVPIVDMFARLLATRPEPDAAGDALDALDKAMQGRAGAPVGNVNASKSTVDNIHEVPDSNRPTGTSADAAIRCTTLNTAQARPARTRYRMPCAVPARKENGNELAKEHRGGDTAVR